MLYIQHEKLQRYFILEEYSFTRYVSWDVEAELEQATEHMHSFFEPYLVNTPDGLYKYLISIHPELVDWLEDHHMEYTGHCILTEFKESPTGSTGGSCGNLTRYVARLYLVLPYDEDAALFKLRWSN